VKKRWDGERNAPSGTEESFGPIVGEWYFVGMGCTTW
jgi:hypothetical protein